MHCINLTFIQSNPKTHVVLKPFLSQRLFRLMSTGPDKAVHPVDIPELVALEM